MDKGEIYTDAGWKSKLNSALAEGCAVAKACGTEVEQAELQATVDRLPDGIRSSMQKDLAPGVRSSWMPLAGQLHVAGNVMA